MPKFGTRSKRNLSEALVDLQKIFEHVIKYFDCSIIEGHRGEEEQNKAYYSGKSQIKYPNGKHNKQPSEAVDAVPYPINWNDTKRMIYFAGFVVGIAQWMYDRNEITHLIRWGGDWNSNFDLNDQTFIDYPHFEIIKP